MLSREELLRGTRRLASRANPKIREWASLHDRRIRKELGQTLAEGARLAGEALSAPGGGRFRPMALLLSDSGAERPEAERLFSLARQSGIDCYSLSDDCQARISSLKNSDGLALVLSAGPEPADFARLLALAGARWLIAAGVQDPGNAGALARTALAAGFSGCLFLEGVDPLSPKFLRGGMGASFRLPCLSRNIREFLAAWEDVRGRAELVQASANPAGGDYRSEKYPTPLLILLGGERGLPRELAGLPARTVHIPLAGGVESLNLAVAAGIVLFEANRRHAGDFPAADAVSCRKSGVAPRGILREEPPARTVSARGEVNSPPASGVNSGTGGLRNS
ncbi:MAG: RNA methyltransferase [Planctomycetota bacterium]|jgi:TrmH family RNA methyltransferase|nr:RNA methyltransferase [Planctomycetota bacterium]